MAKIINIVSQTSTKVNASLDKEELKSLSRISSDAVFSNENNWRLVVGVFKHTGSRRRMICGFKTDFTSLVPMRIRSGTQAGDAYELRKILIVSKNNQSILSIPRADIVSASDYDFIVGEVAAPENFSASISSASSYEVYAPFSVSVSFSKSASNFNLNKLSITNGVASDLSPSLLLGPSASYSFTVTPSAEGAVSVSIPAGQVSASDGSSNIASNSFQRQYYSPVTANITTADGGNTFSEPFGASVTFSKPVTGFELSDLSITNATASNLSPSPLLGPSASYSFLVTPSNEGEISVTLNPNTVISADGSKNSSSSTLSGVQYSTPAIVTITTSSSSISVPFNVNVTFSKPVTDFELTDLSVTNGVASDLSPLLGPSASYSFTVTPSAEGAVSVSVKPSSVSTAFGNTNSGSSSLGVQYSTPATVTVTPASANASQPFNVNVVFNKPVTEFTEDDLSITNGVASNLTNVNNSDTNYSFTVTPAQDGAVSVSVKPGSVSTAFGNTNVSSNTANVSYVSPLTASMSSSVPATVNGPFNVSITFNKSVTGFGLTDLSVTNGVASDLININNSNANYSFTVTPNADGTVSVILPSNAAIEGPSGESNAQASNSISTTYVDLKTLTLDSTAGDGVGTVTASLSGQDVFFARPLVANAASYDFQPGANVSLLAKADIDNYFAGYNGAITSSDPTGSVIMNDDKNISAAFNKSSNTVRKNYQSRMRFLPDNKIIAYGRTSMQYADRRCNFIRLNEDETIDTSFRPVYFNGTVNDFAVDSSGNYIVVGAFTSFTGPISAAATAAGFSSGQANNAVRIAKISNTGELLLFGSLTTTNNGFNGTVNCVTVFGNHVWVGGNFTTYYGDTQTLMFRSESNNANYIAKLDFNGILQVMSTMDEPGALSNGFIGGQVRCMTARGSQELLVGGDFTAYAGQVEYRPSGEGTQNFRGFTCNRIATLLSNGVMVPFGVNDLSDETVQVSPVIVTAPTSNISVPVILNQSTSGSGTTSTNGWFSGLQTVNGVLQTTYWIARLNSATSPVTGAYSSLYGTGQSRSHFYINAKISDSTPVISFLAFVGGEIGNDMLNVTVVEQSQPLPVAGSLYAPSSGVIVGRSSDIRLNSNFTEYTINLTSYFLNNPGDRDLRIVFTWRNDNVIQTSPGAIVSNVRFSGTNRKSGFNNSVRCIEVNSTGSTVWVGGDFTRYHGASNFTSIGSNANRIAKFSSSFEGRTQQRISSSDSSGSWTSGVITNGFIRSDQSPSRITATSSIGSVNSLKLYDNDLWVGGNFNTYMGKNNSTNEASPSLSNNANYIAKINVTSGELSKICQNDKTGASTDRLKSNTTINGVNSNVDHLSIKNNGDILVSGSFSSSFFNNSLNTAFGSVYLAKDGSTHYPDWSLDSSEYNSNFRNIYTLFSANNLSSMVCNAKIIPFRAPNVFARIMMFGNFRIENDDRIWANVARFEPIFINGDETPGSNNSIRIDAGFAPCGFNGTVNDFAVDSQGNYWFVGAFTSFTGPISAAAAAAGFSSNQASNANRIAKLSSQGALMLINPNDKPGANPPHALAEGNGFNGELNCITIDSSDNVWVGGLSSSMTTYYGADYTGSRGTTSNAISIAKLNSSGQLVKISTDDAPGGGLNGFNGNVRCISIDSSNNVWIGGEFITWRGSTYGVLRATANANYIAKLAPAGGGTHAQVRISAGDAAGNTSNGFDTGTTVRCITFDNSGNIWIGGNQFTYYGDTTWGVKGAVNNSRYIVKLNSSGQLLQISAGDAANATGNGFDANVRAIAVDSSNNVWVSGDFTTYSGNTTFGSKAQAGNATRIAKLDNSGQLVKINSRDQVSSNGIVTVEGPANFTVPSISILDGNVYLGTANSGGHIGSLIGGKGTQAESNLLILDNVKNGIVLIHQGSSTRTWLK